MDSKSVKDKIMASGLLSGGQAFTDPEFELVNELIQIIDN
jgi:hypothetical protein